MDAHGLLSAHDALWERRAATLREWTAALARRRQAGVRLDRRALARESALMRASGGLTARQRAWAQRRRLDPVTGTRRRAQRQVLVTWVYHQRRAVRVAAQWATALAAEEAAVEEATRDLAAATARLLETWGKDAPAATGRTVRQLRSLARQPSPSS